MSDRISYFCSSVGSDESGTGGLFGECVFVAFKLTRTLLSKFKSYDWYEEVVKTKDSKNFTEKKCIELSKKIEKQIEEKKDFLVWKVKINTYNNIFKQYESSTKIKCICHNFLHRRLSGESTFHVLDNFFKNSTEKYYKAPPGIEIIRIDKFCKKGELQIFSISIASIIARGRYLQNFYTMTKNLGINLSDKKIESVLDQLEEKGMNRNFIFENYCKLDIVKKYNQKLLSCKKQKTKI